MPPSAIIIKWLVANWNIKQHENYKRYSINVHVGSQLLKKLELIILSYRLWLATFYLFASSPILLDQLQKSFSFLGPQFLYLISHSYQFMTKSSCLSNQDLFILFEISSLKATTYVSKAFNSWCLSIRDTWEASLSLQ